MYIPIWIIVALAIGCYLVVRRENRRRLEEQEREEERKQKAEELAERREAERREAIAEETAIKLEKQIEETERSLAKFDVLGEVERTLGKQREE